MTNIHFKAGRVSTHFQQLSFVHGEPWWLGGWGWSVVYHHDDTCTRTRMREWGRDGEAGVSIVNGRQAQRVLAWSCTSSKHEAPIDNGSCRIGDAMYHVIGSGKM